jgi:hypothetical protein
LAFDVTYNLIKKRSKDNKQWGLGFFSGQDGGLKTIIFGICLTVNEKIESMKRIFANFFEVQERQPDIIITDEQLSISAALR